MITFEVAEVLLNTGTEKFGKYAKAFLDIGVDGSILFDEQVLNETLRDELKMRDIQAKLFMKFVFGNIRKLESTCFYLFYRYKVSSSLFSSIFVSNH